MVFALTGWGAVAPDEKPLASDGIDAMGRDIRKFGEDVAQRIDRIVKKKTFEIFGDPWTMQGIPIIIPVAASGFNLGLRVQMQNILRQDPHEMEIIAQILTSDRGRQKHQLAVDLPWAFGGKYRLGARLAYDRDISLRYFGIGNSVPYPTTPTTYNDIVRGGPQLTGSVLRYFTRHLRSGPLLGRKCTGV